MLGGSKATKYSVAVLKVLHFASVCNKMRLMWLQTSMFLDIADNLHIILALLFTLSTDIILKKNSASFRLLNNHNRTKS